MLLSETHPLAMDQWTNLLGQADQWHGLTSKPELAAWKKQKIGYAPALALLSARAEARSKHLVLREWTHLDFLGEPFVKPTMTPAATHAVEGEFDLRIVDTVRHPLDHWTSVHKVQTLQRVTLEGHLASCAAFASETARVGGLGVPHSVVTYEGFCQDPEPALRAICQTLQIPYDASWQTRWATFDKITGDTDASRGNADPTIKPLTRRPIAQGVLEACLASVDYQAACAEWGYAPED
ncbi:MAG: hypothetical protein ACI89L_000628 [Phycisphaerales bacterium]|jgi:hypothetical protein